MRKANFSVRQIIDRLRCGVSTVLKCWFTWCEEGVHIRRYGSRRLQANSAQKVRHLRIAVLYDTIPITHLIGSNWYSIGLLLHSAFGFR